MTGDITNLEGDGHSLAPGIGTFTISVSKTALTITEGASDSVSIVLNAPQAINTVVSLSLSSQTGVNRFNPIPGSVTIPAGQLSKTVLLSTIDDVFVQAQETWLLTISSAALGATVSPDQTVITLLDNDGGTTAGAGTSLSGPVLLKQFNRQPASSLAEIVMLDGRILYSGTEAAHGTELWISDGTAVGTSLLKDIYPGSGSGYPRAFYLDKTSGIVYFLATTPTEGEELWRTDGTAAGTYLLLDSEPGVAGQTYLAMAEQANGKTYFYFEDTSAYFYHVYVTDGTVAGTKIIQDLVAGATGGWSNSAFSATQQLVYIQGSNKLWVTAGTVGSTLLLTNFGGTTVSNINFYDAGSLMYMIINTSTTPQLWRSDGTIAGTYNVTPGGGTIDTPANAIATPNGKIYFVFNHTTLHLQIVVNDGTVDGSTALVTSGWTSLGFKVAINNTLFFSAAGGNYLTDGTLAGTSLVPVGVKVEAGGVMLGGKYYYRGDLYGSTNEIWSSDGTVAGTSLIKAICNGTLVYGPTNFTAFNGKVYFTADDCGVHGNELWVTDGTASGTQLLEDINPGVADSNPTNLTVVNGKMYMTATKVLSGTQVWVMAP